MKDQNVEDIEEAGELTWEDDTDLVNEAEALAKKGIEFLDKLAAAKPGDKKCVSVSVGVLHLEQEFIVEISLKRKHKG